MTLIKIGESVTLGFVGTHNQERGTLKMGQHKTNPTAIAVKEGKIQRKKKKRMSRKQIKNELAHAFLDHMMKKQKKGY